MHTAALVVLILTVLKWGMVLGLPSPTPRLVWTSERKLLAAVAMILDACIIWLIVVTL